MLQHWTSTTFVESDPIKLSGEGYLGTHNRYFSQPYLWLRRPHHHDANVTVSIVKGSLAHDATVMDLVSLP